MATPTPSPSPTPTMTTADVLPATIRPNDPGALGWKGTDAGVPGHYNDRADTPLNQTELDDISDASDLTYVDQVGTGVLLPGFELDLPADEPGIERLDIYARVGNAAGSEHRLCIYNWNTLAYVTLDTGVNIGPFSLVGALTTNIANYIDVDNLIRVSVMQTDDPDENCRLYDIRIVKNVIPTPTPTVSGATPTPTLSGPTPTPSATPTVSGATPSPTPTVSGPTPSPTPTVSGPSPTPTGTASPTPTVSGPTPTPTASGPTPTPTPTVTGPTPTATPTVSGVTPTPTKTPTISATNTPTPTPSQTGPTPTASPTPTPSVSGATPTPTPSVSGPTVSGPTPTGTPTVSGPTPTPSVSGPTPTPTPSVSGPTVSGPTATPTMDEAPEEVIDWCTGLRVCKWTFNWVSNGAGAAQITTTQTIVGLIRTIITNPGVPAPADNYDVYVRDFLNGADLTQNQCINRDSVNSEAVTLTTPAMIADRMTVQVANAGGGRAGRIVIFVSGT